MSWYIRQSFTYVHLLMLHNLKANFSWLVVRNWMQTLFSGGKVLWLTHSSRSPWLGLSRSLYCCTRGAPLEVALEEYQAACWQWRQAGQWWSGDLSAIWFVFVDFEKLREYLWCLHSENKAMGCLCLEHNRAGWTIFFFFASLNKNTCRLFSPTIQTETLQRCFALWHVKGWHGCCMTTCVSVEETDCKCCQWSDEISCMHAGESVFQSRRWSQ